MKLFQRQRTNRPQLLRLEPVDHSLAAAAIDHAVETYQTAQTQATEGRQGVAELRQGVNLRNGFAPGIEKSLHQRCLGRPA